MTDKQSYPHGRSLLAGIVIGFIIVTAALVVGVVVGLKGEQAALEQSFQAQFGKPYPADEQARLALRPVVVGKLVALRKELDVIGKILMNEEAKTFRGAPNEATLVVASIAQTEELQADHGALWAQFSAACDTAKRAGFAPEGRRSGCKYYSSGNGGIFD